MATDFNAFRVIHANENLPPRRVTPGRYGETIVGGDQRPTEHVYVSHFVLCPNETLNVHYHGLEEVQYVVFGTGIVTDSVGEERQIWPGSVVYCGSGPEGAHGFKNLGNVPLVLICFFPSAGGKAPDATMAETETEKVSSGSTSASS